MEGLRMNCIHVVSTTDNNYAPHLGVMLTSLLENCKSDVHVHVFYHDVSDENIKRIKQIADKYNQVITLYKIDVTKLNQCVESRHINKVAYYRILVPNLLDEKINKVIYLDCDIIV